MDNGIKIIWDKIVEESKKMTAAGFTVGDGLIFSVSAFNDSSFRHIKDKKIKKQIKEQVAGMKKIVYAFLYDTEKYSACQSNDEVYDKIAEEISEKFPSNEDIDQMIQKIKNEKEYNYNKYN